MARHATPYEYGGEVPDAGLGEDAEQTDNESGDAEMVIVDGAAMSYRNYRRREE